MFRFFLCTPVAPVIYFVCKMPRIKSRMSIGSDIKDTRVYVSVFTRKYLYPSQVTSINRASRLVQRCQHTWEHTLKYSHVARGPFFSLHRSEALIFMPTMFTETLSRNSYLFELIPQRPRTNSGSVFF